MMIRWNNFCQVKSDLNANTQAQNLYKASFVIKIHHTVQAALATDRNQNTLYAFYTRERISHIQQGE